MLSDSNFESLFNRSLSGENKAIMLLIMHIQQKELTEQAVKRMELILKEEIAKPDNLCNGYALSLYGSLLHAGITGKEDYPTAIALYERGIRLDNSLAMNNRALMHELGDGGERDYILAITLYTDAIALNFSCAMANLAIMYKEGAGVVQDFAIAIELFKRAVELENSYAMHCLANMYAEGKGCKQDYRAAIKLLERAIGIGYAESMLTRGEMYRDGLGGPVDYPSAARLYRQAMLHGNERGIKQLNNLISSDAQTRYHIYMASKKTEALPDEIVNMFKENPDQVTLFFSNDDLLNEHEKKEIASFIGEYYVKQAHLQLANEVTENFLSLLDKVPEQSLYAKEALIMQADYLFSAAMLNDPVISPHDLPHALLKVYACHRKILDKTCQELDERAQEIENELHDLNSNFALIDPAIKDTKQQELDMLEILLARIKNVMSCVNPLNSLKIDLSFAANWKNDWIDAEKQLLIYAERRQKIDDFSARTQTFLTDLNLQLNGLLNKKTPNSLWCQGFSHSLYKLKHMLAELPSKTRPIELIKLADSVYENISDVDLQKLSPNEAEFYKQALISMPLLNPVIRNELSTSKAS